MEVGRGNMYARDSKERFIGTRFYMSRQATKCKGWTDNTIRCPRDHGKRETCMNKVEDQESKTMIEAWKHFLEDLLEVVLTWLSIVVLFRFRSVCKRWNYFLTCHDFRQRWGEVAPTKQPWFFVNDGGIGPKSMYDMFTKR
ncbi:hypothetical protein V2J09_009713 [Rumex salicifolius]